MSSDITSIILKPMRSWLILLVASLLVGCETPTAVTQTVVDSSAPAIRGDSADVLRVGDRVKIILTDIPTAPPAVEQVIPEDGKLTLHMGVEYNFIGKRATEAEREIANIYINQRNLYKKITVTIERQASFISIGGEVRTPASIIHRGDLSVLAAIDAAGGFTEFADRTKVIVTRASNKQQIFVNAKKAIIDPTLNPLLYPGDSVYVKRSIL